MQGGTAGHLKVAGATAATTLALLTVQFLLGMGVNLTVRLPRRGLGMGSMMSVISGKPLLMIHMALGMLLVVLGLVTVGAAIGSCRSAVIPAWLGLVAILLAGYGGISFLLTGDDVASFTMALGFVVAYAAYFVELVVVARR